MARTPKPEIKRPDYDWFLKAWMDTLQVDQAELGRRCDWGKSHVHGLYHGKTPYNRTTLNKAAAALNIKPFEILMHPEDAMALRRLTQGVRGVEISKELQEFADEREPPLRAVA